MEEEQPPPLPRHSHTASLVSLFLLAGFSDGAALAPGWTIRGRRNASLMDPSIDRGGSRLGGVEAEGVEAGGVEAGGVEAGGVKAGVLTSGCCF